MFGVMAKFVFFGSGFFEFDWPEVNVSALFAFFDVHSSPEASSALSSGRVLLGRR